MLDDDIDLDLDKDQLKLEGDMGDMDDMDNDMDDDDDDLDDMDSKDTVETHTTYRTENGTEVVIMMPRSIAHTIGGGGHTTFTGGADTATATFTIEEVKSESQRPGGNAATPTTPTTAATTTTLTNAIGDKAQIASPPSTNQIIWLPANHPPPPPLYAIKQQMHFSQVRPALPSFVVCPWCICSALTGCFLLRFVCRRIPRSTGPHRRTTAPTRR